jgi:hypothetical protein
MAKKTPYWHPRLGTPDGRLYCASERGDIARLLRDAHRDQRVHRQRDANGGTWYVLHTSSEAIYEAGRVFLPINFPA